MNQEAGALRPESEAPWPWNPQPPQLRNKCLLFRWRKTNKQKIILLVQIFKKFIKTHLWKTKLWMIVSILTIFFRDKEKKVPLYFYVFMFGCAGSSLLQGFSLVAISRSASLVVLHWLGWRLLFLLGRRAPAQAQWLRCRGLVFLQHVQFSQSRDRTCVSCICTRIRYHWATREDPRFCFKMQNLLVDS